MANELYGFKKSFEKVQVRSRSESAAKSHIVPVVISTTPLAAPATRYEYNDLVIPELANWNVVVLRCACVNVTQNLICFRGANTQNNLIDYNSDIKMTGGYYVDWAGNRIRVRWIEGSQALAQSNVKILAVYGLVQNVDVVDQDSEDEPSGDDGEDIDITALTDEVLGIRIGADGTIYETAGQAVREQYNRLAEQLEVLDVADAVETIQTAVDTAIAQIETAGGLILDPTLTQSGQAADAKVTGDAIANVKEDLNTLALAPYMVYVSGGIASNGALITDNTRIRSYPVPIVAGDSVKTDGTYAIIVRLYNSITQSTVSYYDVSGNWTTDDIDLTPYAGKLAIVVVRKVGSETSNISADVSTVGDHVKYSKVSRLTDIYKQVSVSYDIAPITANEFDFASISSAGVITWLEFSNGFGNALTKQIRTDRVTIKPVSNNVMFRIVYYDTTGTWVSNSSWYSKETTSVSTATDGVEVGNVPYRIMIACTTQNQGKSIAELLSGFEFSAPKFENPLIPFSGYKIDAKLARVGNAYKSYINPYDTFISAANGIVVFLSPNGVDANDGLTVLTPKKTFESAIAVTNVCTIILAEGTYQVGTHFTGGLEVTKPLNLIGIGNVVIDNGSGSPINFYRSLFCENIHFRGGNSTIVVKLGAYDRIATFYHCKFTDSTADNGLTVQGGLAYVIECEAYGNAYDGFNYHKYNSILNHTIEINCKSYGNGKVNLDGSDGQSSNGSTTHDGSYIVRVNGEYTCCHGGIVADKESYSANYGCSAGISTITDEANYPDRMSNYWCSGGNMWLYDCISFGSKYDTAIVENGIINSNKIYASNYS